jgi:hypothetical protein
MGKAKLPWSKAAWLAQIQKLRLERGNILLVKSLEIAEHLQQVRTDFIVPIILDPSGVGISKLTRQQLLDALDQLDLIDEKNAAQSA